MKTQCIEFILLSISCSCITAIYADKPHTRSWDPAVPLVPKAIHRPCHWPRRCVPVSQHLKNMYPGMYPIDVRCSPRGNGLGCGVHSDETISGWICMNYMDFSSLLWEWITESLVRRRHFPHIQVWTQHPTCQYDFNKFNTSDAKTWICR